MTDRLTKWLDETEHRYTDQYRPKRQAKMLAALRAVVELHQSDRNQKYGGITFCAHCSHMLGHGRLEGWPCPTIREVEKAIGLD